VALLVEYEPDSIWYETSLTIAAQALKEEVKTEYHTFLRAPAQIRESLTKLGVNLAEKERDEMLTVIDSYTAQIGIGAPEGPKESVVRRTLKISDWSIAVGQDMKRVRDVGEIEEHLHIDDSLSVLLQYNDEKSVVDWVRTRALPQTRSHKELWFLSLATRIASESFYRQLELLCDGILDFKSEEKEGELAHYLRLRAMRGKPFDSRWRKLQVSQHGEVTFVD
jgi:KaiC/GvpD/RAD55 family RecA-like ATPase